MKSIKLLFAILFSLQLFATPMVTSCVGMKSITKETCCPPADCACDMTIDADSDSHVLAVITATNVQSVFITVSSRVFEEFVPSVLNQKTISFSRVDRPPPLKREAHLREFYQVFII